MIISIDSENAFDKFQYPFVKTLSKLGIVGELLQVDKEHLQKPTANILHGEKLDASC